MPPVFAQQVLTTTGIMPLFIDNAATSVNKLQPITGKKLYIVKLPEATNPSLEPVRGDSSLDHRSEKPEFMHNLYLMYHRHRNSASSSALCIKAWCISHFNQECEFFCKRSGSQDTNDRGKTSVWICKYHQQRVSLLAGSVSIVVILKTERRNNMLLRSVTCSVDLTAFLYRRKINYLLLLQSKLS